VDRGAGWDISRPRELGPAAKLFDTDTVRGAACRCAAGLLDSIADSLAVLPFCVEPGGRRLRNEWR